MSTLSFDQDKTLTFLTDLLNIPSPTGYTVEAINYVHQAFTALELPNFDLSITPKGALLGVLRGESTVAPRAVTAHVDTLGMMVKEIKTSGRLKVTALGGIDWHGVEFEGVTVRTHTDQRYRGTCLLHNASVHVNRGLRTADRTEHSMEIRLDERVSNAKEVRALGIEIGDFIFLDPRVEVNPNGFIRSRHLDDKLSVACIYGALLALKASAQIPAQDTYILIANYEEVGHGGAQGFPDDLEELVAIDMAAVGNGQNSDEFSVTLCVKDSGGPYHFGLNNKLRRIADNHEIDLKIDIYPYYASDGTAYWRAGGAARVALIGPGVESSHGYERSHQDAIDASVQLIAHYLLDA